MNKYCQCGCGLELTGRQTKWANDRCRNRGNVKIARDLDGTDMRNRLLKHRYNITQEEFDKILEAQGGGCALCGKPNNRRRNHHVDHDHRTMVVRGILCFRCNVYILGKLTLDELQAAVNYLADPPAPKVVGYIKCNPEANKRRKRRRVKRDVRVRK